MSYRLNHKNFLSQKAFLNLFSGSEENVLIPFLENKKYPEKLLHTGSNALRKTVLGKFNKESDKKFPDFALIDKLGKVYLIRTIYQRFFSYKDLDLVAKKQNKKWPFSWIFVLSIDKIYFDFCPEIIKRHGYARPLSTKWVKQDLQDEYLKKIRNL